jgi:hypothetical protein
MVDQGKKKSGSIWGFQESPSESFGALIELAKLCQELLGSIKKLNKILNYFSEKTLQEIESKEGQLLKLTKRIEEAQRLVMAHRALSKFYAYTDLREELSAICDFAFARNNEVATKNQLKAAFIHNFSGK